MANEDTYRLDYLESLKPDMKWVVRESSTGRGARIATSSKGFDTLREAIDIGVITVEQWRNLE